VKESHRHVTVLPPGVIFTSYSDIFREMSVRPYLSSDKADVMQTSLPYGHCCESKGDFIERM
jgi:hypothetical protein